MTEKTAAPVTEKTANAAPPLPRLLGRLGLYATYVAAALLTLVIAGDLAVLVGHTPLEGWLALLVGTGPLAALLLSNLASYINYYGVWRILRGKDEYDTRQDLKSHAADVPQAMQGMLAGRTGCLPLASVVLLLFSLLLGTTTILPPQTPFIGILGAWSGHVGDLSFNAVPATPTTAPSPTVTPTAMPTPTMTAVPTPTTRPPTATSVPAVIKFALSPKTASWSNCANNPKPPSPTITLDNSGSNVSVHWQASVVEHVGVGSTPWATISRGSGDIPAYGKQTITVSVTSSVSMEVCRLSVNGKPWHVNVVVGGAGTYPFTYNVS